jgi:hypothetical protein
VHIAQIGRKGTAYCILVGKSEGNRPLGRTKHEWEENIKIKSNGIENCGLNSSGSGQGPVVDPHEHSNKALGSVNVWNLLTA